MSDQIAAMWPQRRTVLTGLIGAAASSLIGSSASAQALASAMPAQPPLPPTSTLPFNAPPLALLDRARAAMERHRAALTSTDLIGVADFSRHSSRVRFFIVDPVTGSSQAMLVAHGRGSDPAHSGWLQSFSAEPQSAATSAGAYVTGEGYEGQHGPSRRLTGLEPQNATAADRAIVIHGAWYVDEAMIAQWGKIGRSEGCFAFCERDITTVLNRLGPGRLIYADKI